MAIVALLALGAWWWLRTPAFTLDVNPDRNVLRCSSDGGLHPHVLAQHFTSVPT